MRDKKGKEVWTLINPLKSPGVSPFYECSRDDYIPCPEDGMTIGDLESTVLLGCFERIKSGRTIRVRLQIRAWVVCFLLAAITSLFGTVIRVSFDTSIKWEAWITYIFLMAIALGFAYDATRNIAHNRYQKTYNSAFYSVLSSNLIMRSPICYPDDVLLGLASMIETTSGMTCFIQSDQQTLLSKDIARLMNMSFDCEYTNIAESYHRTLTQINGSWSLGHAALSGLISLISSIASVAMNWNALEGRQTNFIITTVLVLPVFVISLLTIIKSNYEFCTTRLWTLYAVYSYRYLPFPPVDDKDTTSIDLPGISASREDKMLLENIAKDLLRKHDSSIHIRCLHLFKEEEKLVIDRPPQRLKKESIDELLQFFCHKKDDDLSVVPA